MLLVSIDELVDPSFGSIEDGVAKVWFQREADVAGDGESAKIRFLRCESNKVGAVHLQSFFQGWYRWRYRDVSKQNVMGDYLVNRKASYVGKVGAVNWGRRESRERVGVEWFEEIKERELRFKPFYNRKKMIGGETR